MSLRGTEDENWEQAAAYTVELREVVSGHERQIVPPPKTMSTVQTIASNCVGGWVQDIFPNVFCVFGGYIYIARMQIEKLKVLRLSVS